MTLRACEAGCKARCKAGCVAGCKAGRSCAKREELISPATPQVKCAPKGRAKAGTKAAAAAEAKAEAQAAAEARAAAEAQAAAEAKAAATAAVETVRRAAARAAAEAEAADAEVAAADIAAAPAPAGKAAPELVPEPPSSPTTVVSHPGVREDLLGDAPEELLCPLTHELMVDPVMTQGGHTYERVVIERWLTTHNTDPLTGAVLHDLTLRPNVLVRGMCRKWSAHL